MAHSSHGFEDLEMARYLYFLTINYIVNGYNIINKRIIALVEGQRDHKEELEKLKIKREHIDCI